MRNVVVIALGLVLWLSPALAAWGVTGHRVIARVAVATLPSDVPGFVTQQIDWIGVRSIAPDSYRAASEPFIKMEEDPSHEWHLEQVTFLNPIPRSRVEFIQAVYDEYRRLEKIDPARAALTNVRGTGLLPYTAIEVYERLKATFRTWRDQQAARQDTTFTELDAAFYIGWLSHYIADGAMPLHTSVHHDGWVGDNPANYTRNGDLHWGFENDFVDLIALSDGDIQSRIGPAHLVADPFTAILAHLDRSHQRVEQVYALEQRHAFADRSNSEARELVYTCTAAGATVLRDLIYTAWVTSAQAAAPRTGIVQPNDPANPRYNPATGSAPAPQP
jgi:hypothetical protein